MLVGMHRGFMPFDGVMTLHSVVQGTAACLASSFTQASACDFPFLFNLMSKLGGVIACQVNADRVLESRRTARRVSGRHPRRVHDVQACASHRTVVAERLRRVCAPPRVPIIPFVTIGSAEIFPIVGRIDWAWWKKLTEWPFIPVTSPVPLPSKWHTLFLEPMHTERDYGPDAAEDHAVVRRIGTELKRRMEAATADLIQQRKSIFRGSVFQGEVR